MYPSKFHYHGPRVSREGDIYAFGMVVYEVMTGVRPFSVEGARMEELIFLVTEGRRPAKPEDLQAVGFGNGLWDLVENCWNQDRTRRPKTEDVHTHLVHAASMSSLIPPGPRIKTPMSPGVSFPSAVSNSFRKCSVPQFPPIQTDLSHSQSIQHLARPKCPKCTGGRRGSTSI